MKIQARFHPVDYKALLFLLPIVLVLPKVYGLEGVWVAFSVLNFLVFVLAAGLMARK